MRLDRPRAVGYLLSMRASIVASALLLSACYLSHGRPAGDDGGAPGRRDAGAPTDGGGRDAGARPDAGGVCESVAVTHTRVLDPGPGLVTPRLVAMPDGGVGVVYVRRDGAPTRIDYERLGPDLETTVGPVTITNESFTWAQPTRVGDELAIAYGLGRGGVRSRMARASLDGVVTSSAPVDLMHPSLMLPIEGGVFWYAFDTSGTNEITAAQLDLDGTPRHPPQTIVTGRYGSGHGAVPRPDGRSVVLSYPRETDVRGVRQSFVSAIDAAGTLGPERQLSDDGDSAVYPVIQQGQLVLVRHGEALWLEATDLDTLERLDRTMFPPIDRTGRPAAVGPRLVVVHFDAGSFHVDDFGEDRTGFERESVPAPFGGRGPGGSVVELPGAAVYAFHLVNGAETVGFLLRVACQTSP